MPSPLLLTAAAAVLAALGALKRRRKLDALNVEPRASGVEDSALPALTRDQALDVMAAAEVAAIKQALGGPHTPNPHPVGTRDRILWETHYGATLMDWDT